MVVYNKHRHAQSMRGAFNKPTTPLTDFPDFFVLKAPEEFSYRRFIGIIVRCTFAVIVVV